MARIFFLILTLLFAVACKQSVSNEPASPEKAVYVLPYGIENRRWSVDDFIPAHYNIELIEYDTLHPVMQITYSLRRRQGDDYEWVDTVLRLPVSVQQGASLKQLLYGDVYK
ncbi:MAG: hypothetical protein IKL54_01750 [Bacteroidaceae bacterium]|nr:hypothetical protein [Bacteroidaceae bacterium]